MRWVLISVMVGCGDGDKATPPTDSTFTYYTPETDVDSDADSDSDTDTDPGCVPRWSCTPWETDGLTDDATRTCTDLQACPGAVPPVEAATLPALDFNLFRCEVGPILDGTCAQMGCHGTEQDRALRIYARGRLRITGEIFVEPGCLSAGNPVPSENCSGSIECVCWSIPHHPKEDRKNYDATRGLALDAAGVLLADPADSELLTQPTAGGPPHVNVKPFQANDAHYTTIYDWLAGASLPECHTSN